MIKGITGGAGIHVSNNSSSMPYISMSATSAGMVRYNGNSQNFEVYDGSVWMPVTSSFPTIELDGLTMETLTWARKKMEHERHIQSLAAQHPTVADAVSALQKSQEAVDIAVALCDVK